MLAIELVHDPKVFNFIPAITCWDTSDLPGGGWILSLNWIGYGVDFDYYQEG